MTTKKRPVITVVDARPMSEMSFLRGGNEVPGGSNNQVNQGLQNADQQLVKTQDSSLFSGSYKNHPVVLPKPHVLPPKPKNLSSSVSNVKISSEKDIPPSTNTHGRQPPVPASRKVPQQATKAEAQSRATESNARKTALLFEQYSVFTNSSIHQKNEKNSPNYKIEAFKPSHVSTDSLSFSEARSKFGGSWLADKETVIQNNGVPPKTRSKATIIRPKSTFVTGFNASEDKTFSPYIPKSNTTGQMQNYSSQNNLTAFEDNRIGYQSTISDIRSTECFGKASKPCLPRKPTIIRPKPHTTKSMILFDKSPLDNYNINEKEICSQNGSSFSINLHVKNIETSSSVDNQFQNSESNCDVLSKNQTSAVKTKNHYNTAILEEISTNKLLHKHGGIEKDDLLVAKSNADNSQSVSNRFNATSEEIGLLEFGDSFKIKSTGDEIKKIPPPRPAVGPSKVLMRNLNLYEPVPQPKGPRALALFDYDSGYPDDLKFKAGDTIILDSWVDGTWLKGKNWPKDVLGIFPSNFVEIVEPLPSQDTAHIAEPLSSQNTAHIVEPLPYQNTAPIANDQAENDDREQCLVMYDFDGLEDSGELKLKAGDVVFVTRKISEEWLEGEVEDGKGLRKGSFPASFVEIIKDSWDVKSVTANTHDPTFSETTSSTDMLIKRVQAIYDFQSDQEGDLSFKAGEIIDVVRIVNSEWTEGRIDHVTGIFPSNFVVDC